MQWTIAHPCNTEQFKVYGSADETEDMIGTSKHLLNCIFDGAINSSPENDE